jgi:hypothetical protein
MANLMIFSDVNLIVKHPIDVDREELVNVFMIEEAPEVYLFISTLSEEES